MSASSAPSGSDSSSSSPPGSKPASGIGSLPGPPPSASACQDLDGGRHGLGLAMPLALLVVPGSGLEAALHGHLLALAEIPPRDLGEAVPRHDGVILGALLAAADERVRRDGECRDLLA